MIVRNRRYRAILPFILICLVATFALEFSAPVASQQTVLRSDHQDLSTSSYDTDHACMAGSERLQADSTENLFPGMATTDVTASDATTDTLEKMIVAGASVEVKIDLARVSHALSGQRRTTLRFESEPNSFFSVLVLNGEFRGPLQSSMGLVPQGPVALPEPLNAASRQLVIESRPWGRPYEMVVSDATTGFVFFGIQGQQFEYDARGPSLRIRDGRLLLSKEFAAELSRPSDADNVVGSIEISATLRPIEISHVVDGEVTSDVLPANHDNGTTPGPDVIVGDVSGLSQFGGSAAGQVGLAVGTNSCNAGTIDLDWFSLPSNDHPVIPQNLYRMSGGVSNNDRFEQIGQSSVKHAFTALAGDICNFGCNGVSGTHLGSGCSDPYGASLNAGPNLGSRAWINPFTGAYPGSNPDPNNHNGHIHQGPSHRILTNISDLSTDLNQGASYFAEAQYVTPHEYVWCQAHAGECNMYNNVSYRQYNVQGTGSPFSFSEVSQTVRTQPAINAWTGATRVPIQPDPGNDGVGVVAYKVSNPSPGLWHYEYAIYNQNLDRAIQSFTVPVGSGAALSNVDFHAPPQHPGWAFDGTVGNAGYSSMPWAQNQTPDSMTWSSETFEQNPNANAIRWGTMYNFRFDSDHPPVAASATVGFYKTGAPITVAVQGPGANAGTPVPTPTGSPSPSPTLTPTPSPTPRPSPCGSYVSSATTGQAIVPGTTLVAGTSCDDCIVPIALPFPFRFYGVPFSSANVDSNGTLQFDTSETNYVNVCLPYVNYSFTVLPHWDDMIANAAGNGTFTSVSGTAPNRIFNIEWRTAYYGSSTGSANFEIRLYETTGQIDFVYGTVTDAGNSATIGLERDSSVFSQFSCNTSSLSPGTKIMWTATGCATPSPTATPTPTPTPITPTPTVSPTPTPVGSPGVPFDFDGDRTADMAQWRSSEGAWYVLRTRDGFTVTSFGSPADKIVPADFDGDGKTDIAVYRPATGVWYIVGSSDGSVRTVQFGTSEDLPSPGDYDGDNKADISVFRPSNGVWYRLNSFSGSFAAVQFGQSGDRPTLGDFDGDRRADIAVFRPSNGVWYRLNSSNGAFAATQFGASGDLIAPADFDGDGRTDVAVFRPSEGNWYVMRSTLGFMGLHFGVSGDIPAAADLDGDGKADIVVYRPSDGRWYRLNSSTGNMAVQPFGLSTDQPVPAAFRY